jgi:hypothetical protein
VTTAVLPFTPTRAKRSTMMWRWLLGGHGFAWEYLERRPLRDVWAEHRETILKHHIRRRPGTRPLRWWEFDSPGPRRRLGGIGTPLHGGAGFIAPSEYGIPSDWCVRGGYFTEGVPIDPVDPPAFESQAAYLARHKLFLPGERARVPPRAFWRELVQ